MTTSHLTEAAAAVIDALGIEQFAYYSEIIEYEGPVFRIRALEFGVPEETPRW